MVLGEKCPNTELFLVRISRIWTQYGKIRTRKNSAFEKFLHSVGDFNLTIENKHLEELFNLSNLKSLISSPACFQSTNSTFTDLILTNQEELFSNSSTCEAGISDHHRLVSTMLRKISKGSTKNLFDRDYKKFEENGFGKDVTHELKNIKNPSYSQFEKAFVTVLDYHVPLKRNS